MGDRTINTILKLQSESEYKAGLKSCGAELRVLKSDLDRVTSEFRTNANSMEALTKKGAALSRIYETQAQKVELLKGALAKARQSQSEEQATVENLKTQYAQAKRALAEYGDEVDETSEGYQKSKAAVDQLRDAIIQHQAKLDSSTNAVSKYSVQLNRAEVELDRMGDQVDANDRLLQEAKDAADSCATSIDKYGDSVQQAGTDTEKTTSAVDALAGVLVAGGIKESLEDVAAELKEASEASQEYEHHIKQVLTIQDESVLTQKEMAAGLLEVAGDVHRSADEVADAAYESLSAGVETKNVLDFTRQSAQLATAGFTDLSTSVDVLTTVENAYKLSAEHTEEISSKLVKTQDLGKITVDELGKVIGRVIPSAAAYCVNLDNVATSYANMTAAGINAENSTTYLSTMLDELADSGSDVAAILQEQTGKSFAGLMQDGHSLGDVLAILGDSVEGDNVAFSNLWHSATAAKAAVALFDGSADGFNATLEKISNSSGTVARNYAKMADASETSSKRLAVATGNLQIVVGDQLNPVLDDLRASGADVLETAAQAVQENPQLVAAVSGTVVAVGLLAAGLSGLMIAKSVAAAMSALNIALAANPATMMAVAVAGLVGVLAGCATQAAASRAEFEELTKASQTLNETVADNGTAYEESVAGVDAAAETVHGYIDRLKELEVQGLNTQAAQMEYAVIIEKIQHLMPDLNLELDSQTGLLKDGADALRAQADAWAEAARKEALYTRYKADISAMADAEYELARNQALLKLSTQDAEKAMARKAEVERQCYQVTEDYQKLMEDSSLTAEEFAQKQAELDARSRDLGMELSTLDSELAKNQEEQGLLQEAVEASSAAVDANKDQVEAASAAYQAMAAETEAASEQGGAAVTQLGDDTDQASEKMQEAYAEAKASARESIDHQIGLFEALSEECELSTEEMLANLLSQQEAFNHYADNIQIAMDRGINIGLVQQLSDGSASSIQILAELVTATDDEIAEINAAFEGVNEAKDTVADAMAGVSEEVLNELDDLSGDVKDKSYDMGAYVPQGAASGVEDYTPTYLSAIRHMANQGAHEYEMVNAINSPSRRYKKLAHWDVQGLITQYKAEMPTIRKSTKALADEGHTAYVDAARARASLHRTATAVYLPASGSSSAPEEMRLLRQILAAVRAGQKIVLDSGALVGETVGSYDRALGIRYDMARRGAI